MSIAIKDTNIFDPENIIPKVQKVQDKFWQFFLRRKKIVIIVLVLLFAFLSFRLYIRKRNSKGVTNSKTISVKVDKGYEFIALNNQGKPTTNKLKFKISTVEKTNTVIVKDQTFTAKNNKLFLIVNLELKNDLANTANIIPGDLIRLSIGDDDDNKFAPDLHNNLVLVSAISTKLDRVGFVVQDTAKKFKIYVGELEGKKETIDVAFSS